jgi:hypothetical protein
MQNKLNKTEILLNSVVYALYMLFTCLCIMVVEMLVVDLAIGKILSTFITFTSTSIYVIRAVIYTVGVNAVLAILLFREGYKSAEYSVVSTVISGIAASLMHFLLCLLFGFQAFCAGGVRSVTALVLSNEGNSPDINRLDCIPFFFLTAALYIAIMAVFQMLGAKKRISDRADLTSSDNTTTNAKEQK